MIKTLIATGLITANIMGAVNRNNYDLTYKNANWEIAQNDEYGYIKNKITPTIEIDNDVLTIQARTVTQYVYNPDLDTKTIVAYNIWRVTPKLEVTDINFIRETTTIQSQLQQSATYTLLRSYQNTRNTDVEKEALDDFFDLNTYNGQIVGDTVDIIRDFGTQTQNYENDGRELQFFSNMITTVHPSNDDVICMDILRLSQNDASEASVNWENNSDFLSYTPHTLKGQYIYTYTVEQGYDVIDIPGLLYEILAMPFAFMSYAFNLEIWPNTPYAINLSHVFLALIVSGIIIFIIKKVYK